MKPALAELAARGVYVRALPTAAALAPLPLVVVFLRLQSSHSLPWAQAAIVVTAVVAIIVCYRIERAPVAAIARAWRHLEQGAPDLALSTFEEALTRTLVFQHTANVALPGACLAALKVGAFERATLLARAAVEVGPGLFAMGKLSGDVAAFAAIALCRDGRVEEARVWFERAERIGASALPVAEALVAHRLGQPERARQIIESAWKMLRNTLDADLEALARVLSGAGEVPVDAAARRFVAGIVPELVERTIEG